MGSDRQRRSASGSPKKASATGQSTPKRTGILILGMHRSGTSMLTGILSRLGCATAATLMPANFANERGYYESTPLAQLNDHILKSAGTNWDDWQPVNPGWFTSGVAEEFQERAEALIDQEFGTARLFVFKDPRNCRLLPFWRRVFAAKGIAPRILHIHRNPLEVAASLEKRDGIPPEYSQLLWLRNTLEAEAQSRDLPRYFTSFTDVMANWARITDAAAGALDLSWPKMSARVVSEVQEFIAPDLKHFRVEPAQLLENPLLSDWIRESFEIFEQWAHGKTAKSDFVRLDAIRGQLDQSAAAFAGLLEGAADARKALTRADTDLAKTRAEVTAQKTAQEGAAARATTAEARAAEVATALEKTRAEVAAQKTAQEAAAARATTAEARAAEAATALEKTRAEVAAQKTAQEAAAARATTAEARAAEAATALEKTRAEHEQAVAEATRLRSERDAALNDLDVSRGRLAALEDTLGQLTSELAQRSAESDHWAEQVAALKVDLEKAGHDFHRQETEATHWKTRSASLEERLAQIELDSRTESHSLKQRLARLQEKHDTDLVRASEAARAAEQRMSAARDDADEAMNRLRARQHEELLCRVVEVEQQRVQSAAESERLNKALEDAQRQIETLLHTKEEILSSTSWRLTGPLRRIIGRLRR